MGKENGGRKFFPDRRFSTESNLLPITRTA
jgi:hypothetical protein